MHKVCLRDRVFDIHAGALSDVGKTWKRALSAFILQGEGSMPIGCKSLFMAVHGTQVVGFCGYGLERNKISIISVLPRFRRSGLGTLLTYLTASEMWIQNPDKDVWADDITFDGLRHFISLGAQVYVQRGSLRFGLLPSDRSEYYVLSSGLLISPNRKEKHCLKITQLTPSPEQGIGREHGYTFERVSNEAAKALVKGKERRTGSFENARRLFESARIKT